MSNPDTPTPLTPSEVVLIHGARFTEWKPPIAMALGMLGSIVLFGFFGYLGIGTLRDAWASRSWPAISGTIVSSRVHTESDDRGNQLYAAEIRYSYRIDGRAYEAGAVRFGESGLKRSSDAAAKRDVETYPQGLVVPVRYDPSNPGTAVLEPGMHAASFIGFVLGLFGVLVCGAILIFQMPSLSRTRGV